MSGKIPVSDMDPDACEGCPYRTTTDESTGRGVIDTAARLEGEVLERATGDTQYKCGLCGCPLTNLALFNRVPASCPRTAAHGGER